MHSLDICQVQRTGLLTPSALFTLQWARGDAVTASIGANVDNSSSVMRLKTVTKPKNRKASYLLSSGLFIFYGGCMVGTERFELSTYGLRVGLNIYFTVLIVVGRINTNQQLRLKVLDK